MTPNLTVCGYLPDTDGRHQFVPADVQAEAEKLATVGIYFADLNIFVEDVNWMKFKYILSKMVTMVIAVGNMKMVILGVGSKLHV